MAAPRKLERFAVTLTDGQYSIHIEDDDGGTLELAVTRDQLDVIVDTLEDLLLLGDGLDEEPGDGKWTA